MCPALDPSPLLHFFDHHTPFAAFTVSFLCSTACASPERRSLGASYVCISIVQGVLFRAVPLAEKRFSLKSFCDGAIFTATPPNRPVVCACRIHPHPRTHPRAHPGSRASPSIRILSEQQFLRAPEGWHHRQLLFTFAVRSYLCQMRYLKKACAQVPAAKRVRPAGD